MELQGSNEKRRRFESIVQAMVDDGLKGGGPIFNFADAEWVAAEAKALGLLETRQDAELLIKTMAKLAPISQSVCREQVMPALQYQPALDTQSSVRIQELVGLKSWSRVARDIGISKPTLEKMVNGGWRGPIFRSYLPVSKAAAEKTRAYLATFPPVSP